MSFDQLVKLNQLMAFDPRLVQDWYVATHVHFDGLFETDTIETRVRDTAAGGGRVSVIGTSGTGKTSLVEHAMSAEGLLAIWMHVAVEEPELVVDPKGFGKLLVTAIVDSAKRMLSDEEKDRGLAVTGDRIAREGTKRTRKGGAGIKVWGSLDLAKEVTTAAPSISAPVTVAVVAHALRDLLELVRRNGFMPVVVIDDSDRFLQVVKKQSVGAPDLFAPFVTKVLPWLAEFDCAKVVAVHPTYVGRKEWVAAKREGLAGAEIEVPTLDDEDQLGAILERRLDAFDAPRDLDDVFEDGTLSGLFDRYEQQETPTIRKVLTVAHAAVVLAIDQRADVVSALHVEGAQADLE
jgi:hypothetical protein